MGSEFQDILMFYNIQSASTTSKNPQANTVCEHMHQTVANILQTLRHSTKPRSESQTNELIDKALAMAIYVMRAMVHTTLGTSPGTIVIGRDMFLNIPLVADWHILKKKRKHLINYGLRRENHKQRRWDYKVVQKVVKRIYDPTKIGKRHTGPYLISQTHVNGTVTVKLRPSITKQLNI